MLPVYGCLNYQTQSPQMQIKLGVQLPPAQKIVHLSILQILELICNGKKSQLKTDMNWVIHEAVHAYLHCVGSERDRSTQNESLETK